MFFIRLGKYYNIKLPSVAKLKTQNRIAATLFLFNALAKKEAHFPPKKTDGSCSVAEITC